MALVTIEDATGTEVEINPDFVVSLSTYQHFDHDAELPDKLMITNADGLQEVSNDPELKAEADRLRISERTIIQTATGSVIVTGTIAEVKKALYPARASK